MKKPTKQPKYHRLNDEARFKIQHFLDDGVIVSDIAKKLHLPTSTVTREIKRHTTIEKHNGNDCQHYKSCKEAYACKKKCGTRRCRLCKSVECYKVCSNYSPGYCSKLCDESPHVCNGCASLRSCRYEKQLYRAKVADKQAKATDHEKLSHYRLINTFSRAIRVSYLGEGVAPLNIFCTVVNGTPERSAIIWLVRPILFFSSIICLIVMVNSFPVF